MTTPPDVLHLVEKTPTGGSIDRFPYELERLLRARRQRLPVDDLLAEYPFSADAKIPVEQLSDEQLVLRCMWYLNATNDGQRQLLEHVVNRFVARSHELRLERLSHQRLGGAAAGDRQATADRIAYLEHSLDVETRLSALLVRHMNRDSRNLIAEALDTPGNDLGSFRTAVAAGADHP